MRRATVGLLFALGLAVLMAYAVAACRPMRLVSSTVSDGPEYVAIAHWIEQGRPAGFKTRNTALPIAYPLLIAGCERVGVGLVPLNYLCLAVALAASWVVIRRAFDIPVIVSWLILLLVAGCDVCRELSVTVASEMAFFAASMVAIALMDSGRWTAMLLAVPMCAAAILIRTAGVTLLPALAWAVATHPLIRPWITRRTLAVATVPALLAALALSRTEYVSSIIASRYNAGTDWRSIVAQQATKLSAIGELLTSQRAEDFRLAFQSEFGFLGAILVVLMVIGLCSRRGHWRPVDLCLVAYCGVMFVYPFFGFGPERRFLFPAMPLMAAMTWIGLQWLVGRRAPLESIGGMT